MKTKRSMTFVYPSKTIGGAQILFVRLAKELAKRDDLDIRVVDYPEGYLRSQLLDERDIAVLPYSDSPVLIEDETIVVTPLSHIADLDLLVKVVTPKFYLLLWAIHPDNISYALYGMGRRWLGTRQRAKQVIKELCDAGNIIYMDQTNYLSVKNEINCSAPENYIPIPVPINVRTHTTKRSVSDTLNIAWLGRFSYDKVFAIYKIIDEVKQVSDQKIILHLIGDGKKLPEVKQYLLKSKIDYRLSGILEGEDLTNYLRDNIDLGIAMGTSCMEFALREVPALLIDYSLAKFPETIRYNWLYETEAFNLGSHVESAPLRKHSFSDVISLLRSDPEIGNRSFQYVRDNHAIHKVAAKLLDCADKLIFLKEYEWERVQAAVTPPAFRVVYNLLRRLKKTYANC